jgi:hypothetical protein
MKHKRPSHMLQISLLPLRHVASLDLETSFGMGGASLVWGVPEDAVVGGPHLAGLHCGPRDPGRDAVHPHIACPLHADLHPAVAQGTDLSQARVCTQCAASHNTTVQK